MIHSLTINLNNKLSNHKHCHGMCSSVTNSIVGDTRYLIVARISEFIKLIICPLLEISPENRPFLENDFSNRCTWSGDVLLNERAHYLSSLVIVISFRSMKFTSKELRLISNNCLCFTCLISLEFLEYVTGAFANGNSLF